MLAWASFLAPEWKKPGESRDGDLFTRRSELMLSKMVTLSQ